MERVAARLDARVTGVESALAQVRQDLVAQDQATENLVTRVDTHVSRSRAVWVKSHVVLAQLAPNLIA